MHFQAETKKLLDIVAKSIYTDKVTLVTLGPEKNVKLAHTDTVVGGPGSTSQTPPPDTPTTPSQTLRSPSRTGVPDPGSPPPPRGTRGTLATLPPPPQGTPGYPSPGPLGTPPGTPWVPLPGPLPRGPGYPSPGVPGPLPGTPPRDPRKPGIGRFPRKRPKPCGTAGFITGSLHLMGDGP